MMLEQVLEGVRPAVQAFPTQCRTPGVELTGLHRRAGFPDTRQRICLEAADLARGVLTIGAPRIGKTNVIAELLAQQLAALQPNEKIIVLDVKGEYYAAFGEETDVRFDLFAQKHRWNLFRDILAWGTARDQIAIHTDQLCAYLYLDQKNEQNPFFPLAARVITSCVMQWMIRRALEANDLCQLHNAALRAFLLSATVPDYVTLFREYEDFQSAQNYLVANGFELTREGAGILAEIDIMVRRMFVGAFGCKGDFSIVEWLQQPAGGVVFLSSHPNLADVVHPVLAFCIDSSIDALSAHNLHAPSRTAFFLDEAAQLPMLRSLKRQLSLLPYRNVSVVMGLQDVRQLSRYYSEAEAEEMLNLFQTIICLHAPPSTIQYVQKRFGTILVAQSVSQPGGTMTTQLTRRNAIEDYEILRLKVGEAFVRLPNGACCQFQFDHFGW